LSNKVLKFVKKKYTLSPKRHEIESVLILLGTAFGLFQNPLANALFLVQKGAHDSLNNTVSTAVSTVSTRNRLLVLGNSVIFPRAEMGDPC